ncbi:sigma-70 family RNA polymerase sigma factor [Oceanidesulfovibrio indonesiensis]|uniref:Sigma-70 family RNA polymerase sigma factor n=1 Tax=Oceanidesulfovibrio indonesiensis TaxID=54767 RepID=A0A7M3MC59_9BACT|nr:sigma-70 family RNA polymerase sigma factor [Oceanidesulfovibrio indonesiensis]TVM15942.1 sigma-70 family RNA polymerase sigma factor [Oceanidesulfovibrio indonesiensis]
MRKAITSRNISHSTTVISTDLEACLAGDDKAWRQFLIEYGPLLRRAVRWKLRQRAAKNSYHELETDTDEVVQEVYFRLVRSEYKLLRTYDPERSSLSTWLCVVARSAALDHLRNRKHTVQMSPEEVEQILAVQEEEGGMLALPRGVLSPRQTYVLHLAFEKDAGTNEIAELMDVHPQTVRSLRNSALMRLRWHYTRQDECKDGVKEQSRNAKRMQSSAKIAQHIGIS